VEVGDAEDLAGSPEARDGLERAGAELTAIRANGRVITWSAKLLLLISGFSEDKATGDKVAAELREKFQDDAMTGPGREEVIAVARAHLGETDVALQSVKQLLQIPNGLTPAQLRADPFWDPLRNDPRFKTLLEGPEPKTVYQ